MRQTIDHDLSTDEVDVVRVETDNAYRRELAGRFVSRVGVDIDHTGLRPAIRSMFPQLARRGSEAAASKLVGTIATMLVNGPPVSVARERDDMSVGDARSGGPVTGAATWHRPGADLAQAQRRAAGPIAPAATGAPAISSAAASPGATTPPRVEFDFPATYGELSAKQKRTLEEFCRQRIERGERDANVVLARLRERYGWPYTKQTFCVGPWRMARQRHRHAAELRESTPPLPSGEAGRGEDATTGWDQPDTDSADRIRFSGERGQFAAHRGADDMWAVEVRAHVPREEMLRFQARAFDLLFPSGHTGGDG